MSSGPKILDCDWSGWQGKDTPPYNKVILITTPKELLKLYSQGWKWLALTNALAYNKIVLISVSRVYSRLIFLGKLEVYHIFTPFKDNK